MLGPTMCPDKLLQYICKPGTIEGGYCLLDMLCCWPKRLNTGGVNQVSRGHRISLHWRGRYVVCGSCIGMSVCRWRRWFSCVGFSILCDKPQTVVLATTWLHNNALHHIHGTNTRANARIFFRLRKSNMHKDFFPSYSFKQCDVGRISCM